MARTELSHTTLCPALGDPVLESATFLNEIASRHPTAISLAAGRPYDDFFDPAELTANLQAYQEYLADALGMDRTQITRRLFQYGRTAGHIHELIARTLANDEDMHVDPESIVVVTGAQEGMLITVRALCHGPGDVLLVASPCYIGMLGAAKLLGVDVVPVPEGEHGLEPDAVAQVVRNVRAEGRVPKALYLVPNFSNPSGHTLPEARRRDLLALAEREDLLLIEDDPYGFLADPEHRVPALKTLDTSERVIHIGTFAKTCFPGARVGYVVAGQTVRKADGSVTSLAGELSLIRSMITVNTSSVAQAVIGGALIRADCRLREANAGRITFYRDNLRLLLSTLDDLIPAQRRLELGISWNVPDAGFFVIVRVPFVVDDELLAVSADEYGVLWTPMSYFYPGGEGGKELRVGCSALSPADLTEGVRRLAQLLTDRAEHESRAS
ncbi:PLP-dependent aminotransferase family protein [Kibdelosporangium aridum]|uniref:PLP-dependent aminotransferase family protein n=1 Tax=Kibdelosporangium aridum TaxID=2030 RepID=A0A428Z0N6_KIBAR|nr:PLP-dependent aminotransferase family protein [Kibdelosporangium aridum]RSM77794.1 PLP-dependent aminotransferase family protein [Kibdelosporangium aridum]